MKLTFSVIICTLNNSLGVKKVLENIECQNIFPNEIIIVQGGINIKTEQIVNQFKERLNIKYAKMEKSLVKQRNAGLKLAKGDIIFFLDDDVILEPNYFSPILVVYENDANNEIGGVQGTILNSPKGKKLKNFFNKIFFLEENHGNGKLKKSGSPSFLAFSQSKVGVNVFNGCQMTFRRDIIKEIQFDPFFEKYWLGDDFEASYSISKRKKLIQTPNAKLYHLGNASFINSVNTAFMIGRNYPYIRKKHNLDKGIGIIFCLWSDLGRVIFYFILGIRTMQMDNLIAWIKGRKAFYKEYSFR